MGVKVLVKLWKKMFYINFQDNRILSSETRDDLSKDRYNAYHTPISMSFINKYIFDKQEMNKQPGLGMK